MANKSNKKFNMNALLYPLVMLLAGICMVVFGAGMLNIALYIVGALFIVSGIITLIKKEFIPGAFHLIVGIVIILLGSLLIKFAVLIIGIILLVVGVVGIIKLIIEKKSHILNYVAPIVLLLIGILLVCGNFFNFVDIILKAAGICLIIYAIYKLLLTIFEDKITKKK